MTATEGEIVQSGDQDGKRTKENAVIRANATVIEQAGEVMIKFRGDRLYMVHDPEFPHFRRLAEEEFSDIAYKYLGAVKNAVIKDLMKYKFHSIDDYSHHDHLILFGLPHRANHAQGAITQVWNSRTLEFDEGFEPNYCIWRSPYAPLPLPHPGYKIPFIMSLAGGDEGLYDDYMQSLAPIIMEKKPVGVCWWIGEGANGKTTLMDAIYEIFPEQLVGLTAKDLEANKDTLRLNGKLANIVRENSEGRIEDTQVYKSIGTHEDFEAHKFFNQYGATIRGNMHHILSANAVPAFNDKGHSARRRTYIIPFTQQFENDLNFKERTFTPEFFGHLITEMMRYAHILRARGYKYKWSAKTLAAKLEYDAEANTAEDYMKFAIEQDGLVGYKNQNSIYRDYERWCGENLLHPLGISNFKLVLKKYPFKPRSTRVPGVMVPLTIYRLPETPSNLVEFGIDRNEIYTTPDFQRELPVDEIEVEVPTELTAEPEIPPADEDVLEEKIEERPSVLKGDW